MVDAPLAPVLPSLAQSARLAPACARNPTQHSQLLLVPVCPLLVEALTFASAVVDAGDAPVIPSSPSYHQSMRKNLSNTLVPSNPPPVPVFPTPASLRPTVPRRRH